MHEADLLGRAVAVGVALVALLVLLPSVPGRLPPLRRAAARGRARLSRYAGSARETGTAALARRAAAGLLGSASALVALAAPARAAAPDATASHVASTAPAQRAAEGASPAARVGAVVVVRRGDTLWDLARRHLPAGATDAQIAREWPRWYAANRAVVGPDPGLLLPGQRLRVPGPSTTGTPSTPHHRSPVAAAGPRTSVAAASLDPDRR